MAEVQYPECGKIAKIRDKSQAVGGFCDWLQGEKGYVIAEYTEQRRKGIIRKTTLINEKLMPINSNTQRLLEEFFGIDPVKVESEKQAMLKEIRESQALHNKEEEEE